MSEECNGVAKPNYSLREGDRAWLEEYFTNGFNATAAEIAINPDVSKDSARGAGCVRLARIHQCSDFQELLTSVGLDDFGLAVKAKELFEATQTLIDSQGNEHEVRDNKARLGALQTVGRWRGKDKASLPDTQPIEIKITHDTEGI
ncbi:hypothetical protein CCP3SC15_3760007 [Gammaproteobacteria bacterium]